MNATAETGSCGVKSAIAVKPKTVSVNGVVISRGAIARETQNHPADKPIAAWLDAAQALVIRELLLQEARRLDLTPLPATDDDGRRETTEEALVRHLIDTQVVIPRADAEIARRYYDINRERFRSHDLFEVSHILLAVAPGDTLHAEVRAQAQELVLLLRADATQFADIARALSACSSRDVAGNLGQIGPGQTVPEFEKALVGCPVGEVAPEPIETRFGFHIVRVAQRIAGRDLPFEMVEQRIRDWLEDKVRRTAIRQYIEILAGKADIVGVDLGATHSPLVQ